MILIFISAAALLKRYFITAIRITEYFGHIVKNKRKLEEKRMSRRVTFFLNYFYCVHMPV